MHTALESVQSETKLSYLSDPVSVLSAKQERRKGVYEALHLLAKLSLVRALGVP